MRINPLINLFFAVIGAILLLIFIPDSDLVSAFVWMSIFQVWIVLIQNYYLSKRASRNHKLQSVAKQSIDKLSKQDKPDILPKIVFNLKPAPYPK